MERFNLNNIPKPEIEIALDGKYYRVELHYGTHKLHSEKLNLKTAFDLAYRLRRLNIQ